MTRNEQAKTLIYRIFVPRWMDRNAGARYVASSRDFGEAHKLLDLNDGLLDQVEDLRGRVDRFLADEYWRPVGFAFCYFARNVQRYAAPIKAKTARQVSTTPTTCYNCGAPVAVPGDCCEDCRPKLRAAADTAAAAVRQLAETFKTN